jgi:hypothetical protein
MSGVETNDNVRERPATCAICIDTFNYVGRKKITCESCNTEICMKCIKRFLAENVQEPNCMNCREVYTNQFMDQNFGYTYRRTLLKNVRLEVLVAREKQIMPDLMHRADAYRKSKTYSKNYNQVRSEIRGVELRLDEVYSNRNKLDKIINNNIGNVSTVNNTLGDEFMKTVTDAIINSSKIQFELEGKLTDLEKKSQEYLNKMYKYENIYFKGGFSKTTSVMHCLKTDCKGFLNENYECGLCHAKMCKDCHEELIDEQQHVCKQENIDSIKVIENETKQCPTCKTRVYKIEGCDQMFCVQCHTAFSWDTGSIERGRIHNPHYFEWLRNKRQQMPREIGDIPCGGLPNWWAIYRHCKTHDIDFTITAYLHTVYTMTEYLQNKEIRKYPVIEGRDEELNKIAVDYMVDKLPENMWKNRLFQLERKREINNERRLILDMMVAVLVDLFGDIFSLNDNQSMRNKLNEFHDLRKYFNESIKNLGKRFDLHNFKIIDETWISWTN